MSVTEAQCRRALRHANIPWDSQVIDSRDSRWVVHPLWGLLGGMSAAFAAGRKTLRRVEDFLADVGRGARRALGLTKETPSDTTLYRVVANQSPKGLAATVWAQIHDLVARKVVRNDLLPLGVVTFDGKGTWSSTDTEVPGAKVSSCDSQGAPLWMFGALRACLTSSSVRPCLTQKLIGSKEGESPAFRELFPEVCQEAGRLFQVVTGDSGLCARENAEVVRAHDKWYVFGVKGNQPHLHELAHKRFFHETSNADVLARTEERAKGKTVVRELFALSVRDDRRVDFKDAQQLWYVRQTTTEPNGSWAAEQRYFVTAIPEGALSRDQELSVVRMHWGIESAPQAHGKGGSDDELTDCRRQEVSGLF